MSDHFLPIDVLDDLRNVLDDMDDWQLDPAGWADVDTLIERVASSLAAGATDEFRDAVAYLGWSGPTKVKSADSGTTGKQPPKIREKVTRLKDTLESPKQSGQGKPNGESGGR
ncbi:CATRA system-associated protein [Micromonospora haikouensis]|uniref:CATRA system-associated protein n=1 Tax=Micromonospora haikouensis TaxID=686309 RepID=UPI003D721DA3